MTETTKPCLPYQIERLRSENWDLGHGIEPCPFCGNPPKYEVNGTREVQHVIQCGSSCPVEPYSADGDYAGALNGWNARPLEAALRAEVETQREAMQHHEDERNVFAVDRVQNVALRAEVKRLHAQLRLVWQVTGDYCGACGWAMKFADECLNCKRDSWETECDALRAELAQAREEIAKLRSECAQWKDLHDSCHPSQVQLTIAFNAERAAREKAEARVTELEEKIVACGYCEESSGWHNITQSQIEQRCERYCPNHKIHAEARAILAARQKEESK